MQDQHQAIAELAYSLWEARGRPEGERDQIWFDAERQVRLNGSTATDRGPPVIDDTLKDSFPASDPPSSRIPDEPPSNANEKWRSAGIEPPGEEAQPVRR